jgi:hypothetical protein
MPLPQIGAMVKVVNRYGQGNWQKVTVKAKSVGRDYDEGTLAYDLYEVEA